MSSNNNNDNSAAATAVGFVGAGMVLIGLFLLAAMAFLAFVLTILCVIACFKPFRIGKWNLTQEEASPFLLRGVFGMLMLPAFILFSDIMFGIGVVWDYLPHMMCVGYVGGSVGWGLLTADSNAQAEPEIIPQSQQITYQPGGSQSVSEQREPEPFKYASWDDEEEFRK